MEALKLIQELFSWTSVCPSPEKLSSSMKLLREIYTVFIALFNTVALFASIAFLNKLETTDLEAILYVNYQMVSIFAVIYMLITAILLRQKIQDLFSSFIQMHEQSELPK